MTINRVAVVLPGIMGSRLAYGEVEIWGDSFFENYDRLIRESTSLSWTGRRADASLLKDVYVHRWLPWRSRALWDGLLGFLARQPDFGQPNGTLVFPYDWRESLLETASLLADGLSEIADHPIAQAPSDAGIRFAFFTHSMGGLVVRVAVGLGLLAPEWIDRLVHLGCPLLGAPKAFRSAFGGGVLPGLDEAIGVLRGRHKGTFWRHLLACFQTFPSIYQLMPPLDNEYLIYTPLVRANPLREDVIDPVLRSAALAAHVALEKAELAIRVARVPVFSIFTSTSFGVKTELEYEVAAIRGSSSTYEVKDIFSATSSGDGTVPAYSARGCAAIPLSVIDVRHTSLCNDGRVVSLLPSVV